MGVCPAERIHHGYVGRGEGISFTYISYSKYVLLGKIGDIARVVVCVVDILVVERKRNRTLPFEEK